MDFRFNENLFRSLKDQHKLDTEINKLRDDLKVKLKRLNDLEGTDNTAVESFFLKPMNMNELNNISKDRVL